MAVKFLEAGTDATQSIGFWSFGGNSADLTSSNTQAHTGSRSLRIASRNAGNAYILKAGVLADAGRRISFYVNFDTLPNADISLCLPEIAQSGLGACFGLTLKSTGALAIYDKNLAIQATGSTILSVNTWYRISLTYKITSAAVNTITVHLNGIAEITATNITVLTSSDTVIFGYAETAPNASNRFAYFDDFYIDDGTSGDPGDVRVTAKRPNANGSLNEFTTQIGAGGSGYGSGHSPQVNEQPSSTTNGWSISTTTKKTEEYSIEGLAVGDVDLTGKTILGLMGWIAASVDSTANSPVHNIIVKGTATAKTMTTSAAIYTQISSSTTYPTGNTDIGMDAQYTTTPHLTRLFDCGIQVAFVPPPVGKLVQTKQAINRSNTY